MVEREVRVAKDGSGDYRSIQAALEGAEPGTRLRVAGGEYRASLAIEDEVEIVADDPEGAPVVITGTDAGATVVSRSPFARLRGLEVRAHRQGESAVHVSGGELCLEQCAVTSRRVGVRLGKEGVAMIRHCHVQAADEGYRVEAGARAWVEGGTVSGSGVGLRVGRRAELHVSRLRISDCGDGVRFEQGGTGHLVDCEILAPRSSALVVQMEAEPVLERCRVESPGDIGFSLQPGARGAYRDCRIEGGDRAAVEIDGAEPLIWGCLIRNEKSYGVAVSGLGGGRLERCTISGAQIASVYLSEQADPWLLDCAITEGLSTGIRIDDGARGRFEGCRITDNKSWGVSISQSAPVFRRCLFRANDEMAFYATDEAQVWLEDCAIKKHPGNQCAINDRSVAIFVRCEIVEGAGAGISVYREGLARLEACRILSNAGDGFIISENGRIEAVDCHIAGNGDQAVYIYEGGSALLERCQVEGDFAGGEVTRSADGGRIEISS